MEFNSIQSSGKIKNCERSQHQQDTKTENDEFANNESVYCYIQMWLIRALVCSMVCAMATSWKFTQFKGSYFRRNNFRRFFNSDSQSVFHTPVKSMSTSLRLTQY